MAEPAQITEYRSSFLDCASIKWIIHEGCGLLKPNEGALCTVHISPICDLPEAASIVGYTVDSDCEICLGTGTGYVSGALDQCMESMRAGETCKLSVTQESVIGVTNVLQSDDRLQCTFTVHLIRFTRSKELWEMTEEEKLDKSSLLKDLGTKCFKATRTLQAEWFYIQALKYLISIGKQEDIENIGQHSTLRCLLSLNIAACQLKHRQYKSVVIHCSNALGAEPSNTKALYRRGQAYMGLQDYELARSDFEETLKLDPNNKAVKCQMKLLGEKMKQLAEHYAHAMGKMFGGPALNSKK